MTTYNHDAIRRAYPNAVTIEDGFGVKDASGKVLNLDQAKVDAAAAEIAAEQAATAYQRQRAPEYPPISDLADALYWSSKGDDTLLTAYYDKCAEVKANYPKPNN